MGLSFSKLSPFSKLFPRDTLIIILSYSQFEKAGHERNFLVCVQSIFFVGGGLGGGAEVVDGQGATVKNVGSGGGGSLRSLSLNNLKGGRWVNAEIVCMGKVS